MEIDEKYVGLLGKYVYSKKLDKFGFISSIEIAGYISGYGIQLRVYYDCFDNYDVLFFDDILKGEVQFTIISDVGVPKEIKDKGIEDIKAAFGGKFNENMLMFISEDERTERIREREEQNVQVICNDLTPLDRISAEVMYNDYDSRKLYLSWKEGAISEKELLYGLVNHLCKEYKRVDKKNLDYFIKYEFMKEMDGELKCDL